MVDGWRRLWLWAADPSAGRGDQRTLAGLEGERLRDLRAQGPQLALARYHEQRQKGQDSKAHEAQRGPELRRQTGRRGRRSRGSRTPCRLELVESATARGLMTGSVCSAIASISRGWTLLVRVFSIQ